MRCAVWRLFRPADGPDAWPHDACALGKSCFKKLTILAVVFEESIAHKGAPFRIALSGESEDEYESCVILSHIPHNGTP